MIQIFDFDYHWNTRRIRRQSGIDIWIDDHYLREIRSAFRYAFLTHHACLRYGRQHFGGGDERPPDLLFSHTGFERGCPCRQRKRIDVILRTFGSIARAFHPGDTIVTFNYDVTVEAALWHSRKWSFATGYGFAVDVSHLLRTSPAPDCERISALPEIRVLKPHGSVNWVKNNADGKIGVNYLGLLFGLDEFSTYKPTPDYEEFVEETEYTEDTIIAPTYEKDYSAEPILVRVWDQIDVALSAATEIAVIGYSLPKGDASARDRLARSLSQNSLCKSIKIVSPYNPITGEWPAFLDRVGKCCDWERSRFERWVSALAA